MKYILTILALMFNICLFSQELEVDGKVIVSDLEQDDDADSLVIVLPDGSLGVRTISSIQELIDQSILNFGISLGSAGIQGLLDAGYSPLKLLDQGVPADSLYGKTYQGGLIFYLDDQDTIPGIEGMVAAPIDQGSSTTWGCFPVDLPDVPNYDGAIPVSGPGVDIGEGYGNTMAILSNGNCPDAPVALLATEYSIGEFNDWFLPSINELNEMHRKIGKAAPAPNTNIAGFQSSGSTEYWSSTELDGDGAWTQENIASGDINVRAKLTGSGVYVRAVRNF